MYHVSPIKTFLAALASAAACIACVPMQWADDHDDLHVEHGKEHQELELQYERALLASIERIDDQYFAALARMILEAVKHDLTKSLSIHESSLADEAIVQMRECIINTEAGKEVMTEITEHEERLDRVYDDDIEGTASIVQERKIIRELGSKQREYLATITKAQGSCWERRRSALHASVDKMKAVAEESKQSLVQRAKVLLESEKENRRMTSSGLTT